MFDVQRTGQISQTGTPAISAQEVARLKEQRVVREQKTEAAAGPVPIEPKTNEEIGSLQKFYNSTLQAIGNLRGQRYTLPTPKSPANADTAKTGAVKASSSGQPSLEARAKDVVRLNIARLNETEKTGKLPLPLPMDQANDNFKTMVDYVTQSPEANAYPQIKGAMQEDIEKAKELHKKAGDNALPFPMYLAQVVGQDDRIPPPLAMSAVDFTRSYGEFGGK